MLLYPNAKINLGLHVLHKREDGFHEIETAMVPIPLFDILEILPAKELKFVSSGIAVSGALEDNLCVKAFRLLEDRFSIPPVYMHLRKQIPMGAGMGGGSADAAFVLKGINELFDLQLSSAQLENFAGILGSDCPFFIKNKPQLARGRGEILGEINIDLKGMYLKIVNPGIHISTKEAYAGIQFQERAFNVEEILTQPKSHWKKLLHNDFENGAFKQYPTLEQIKFQLYQENAEYAAMSGSGSTMFGLFTEPPSLSFGSYHYMETIVQL
ncbi:MAG: 4-(cytidine 5'-diphospho)-2-C-methyl-D-erythritol kinase [Bacteroidota bacterium]